MKKVIAIIGILSMITLTIPAIAADSVGVSATVTPEIISVSVDISDVNYGVLDVSETSAPSVVITATNDGNSTEKFEIRGSDSTNWTLSDTAVNEDVFMHEFATDDDSYTVYTALNNSTYDTLDASVATLGTQLFKLRLKMPSSTTTTAVQSTTVTVLATAF